MACGRAARDGDAAQYTSSNLEIESIAPRGTANLFHEAGRASARVDGRHVRLTKSDRVRQHVGAVSVDEVDLGRGGQRGDEHAKMGVASDVRSSDLRSVLRDQHGEPDVSSSDTMQR